VPFQFDDRPNIIQNPNVQIHVLTWDRIEGLIKNTYNESIRVFSYMTLAFNYYLGGFNVFGYHVFNLVVHIASGFFLYGFLILTFRLPSLEEKYGPVAYRVALFASLLFICHPVQTQAVTYIVQRMASMGGMFYLLSMVLYLKARTSAGRARSFYYGGLGVAYLLGIFSKENVAILPLFIALYEFYFFRNLDLTSKGRRFFFALVAGLAILAVVGLIIWGRRYCDLLIAGYQVRPFTLSERLLTQFRVVLYYLTLLIYPEPSRLNLDYDFPVSRTLLDPSTTLLSILITVALMGLAFWKAKKRPFLSFWILWYFGNLVIESSVFPLEMVFEHRLYLPSVGPFVLFSLLLVRAVEKAKAKYFPVETVRQVVSG